MTSAADVTTLGPDPERRFGSAMPTAPGEGGIVTAPGEGGIVTAPGEDQPTAKAPRGPAAPERFEPGMVLGERYRLDERLGAGGMGEAWRATHVIIGRKVALKVLLPGANGADDGTRAERMLREASVVGRIDHPNIVKVLDFGTTPGGSPFFVMTLVRGRSLDAVCREEGPLPWPRACRLLVQLAEGLGAAHELGVIHRDIKPDNVLVESRGDEEVAQVIDFGIAKSESLEGDARKLTRTGMLCGTPAFMSPEQIRGDAIDARADVYGLGCVAYGLLTGRRPFAASNVFQQMYAHLYTAPEPLPPEVPEPLAAVVLRCLAKDPAERYATMAELSAALLGVESPARVTGPSRTRPPVVVQAEPPEARSVSSVSRGGVVAGALAATLVAGVVAYLVLDPGRAAVVVEPGRGSGQAAVETAAPVAAPAAAEVEAVVEAAAPSPGGDDPAMATDPPQAVHEAPSSDASADAASQAVDAAPSSDAPADAASEAAEEAPAAASPTSPPSRASRRRRPGSTSDPSSSSVTSEPTWTDGPSPKRDAKRDTFDVFGP